MCLVLIIQINKFYIYIIYIYNTLRQKYILKYTEFTSELFKYILSTLYQDNDPLDLMYTQTSYLLQTGPAFSFILYHSIFYQ